MKALKKSVLRTAQVINILIKKDKKGP